MFKPFNNGLNSLENKEGAISHLLLSLGTNDVRVFWVSASQLLMDVSVPFWHPGVDVYWVMSHHI